MNQSTLVAGCTRDVQALDAQQIEQQYGLTGAHAETIATSDGLLKGMLVPITLASGLQGLHPVQLGSNVTRTRLADSPGIGGLICDLMTRDKK